MPKNVLIALRLASMFVVIAGFLALATTQEFDAILVLIPIILAGIMPICEQLDAQFSGYRKVTSAVNLVVLPLVIAAPLFLGLLNAVVLLVIYIQIYLLLHQKRERDYYYLYLMAFFLLVAACVLAPDATIALVMLLFLVSSIWAFLILQVYVETDRNQSAATPDLLALHEHDHQTIAPPENWLDAGIVLPVMGLCAMSIVLTVALFLFTPRMEAGFFGRNDPARFVTGLDSEVAISTSGEIEPDPRIVLRAEFPEEPGGRYDGEFFWRSCAYNSFNGARWTQRRLATGYDDGVPDAGYRVPLHEDNLRRTLIRDPSRNGRLVRQVIYLDDIPNQGLPCLSTVARLDFDPPSKDMRLNWSDEHDSSVVLRTTRQTSITYEAWSEVEDDVAPDTLRGARENYSNAMGLRDYTLLTSYELTPAAEALARELTENSPTIYDKVSALEQWFNSPTFIYSFQIPTLDPEIPIDDFLLNTRIGHCELYASAMVMMLRSLGIPSRVASGYRGAEWVESEGAYVVRADMAHLWVEVYFLDFGWFSFDPSPPIDRELTGFGRLTRQASLWALRAKMLWLSEVVGFRGFQWNDLRSFSAGIFSFGADIVSARDGNTWSFRLPVLALFVLFAATAVAFYVRSKRRPRGRTLNPLSLDQLRAQRLFRNMRVRLRQVGVVADGKTAEELAESFAHYPPEPRQSVLTALHVYNAARFGGRPLPADQLARLKHGLRVLKKQPSDG